MEELSGLDFTPFQDQWLLEGCKLQLVSHDSHMMSHDALYINAGRSWINLYRKIDSHNILIIIMIIIKNETHKHKRNKYTNNYKSFKSSPVATVTGSPDGIEGLPRCLERPPHCESEAILISSSSERRRPFVDGCGVVGSNC